MADQLDTTTPRHAHSGRRPPDRLSGEEERELVRLVQAGLRHGPGTTSNTALVRDAEARLVEAHIGLVRALAARIGRRPGADIGALEGAGMEALVCAIRKFDPGRSKRLVCYVAITLARAMRHEDRRSRGTLCTIASTAARDGGPPPEGAGEPISAPCLVPLDEASMLADSGVAVADEAIARVDRARLGAAFGALDEADRSLLARRHGLSGREPQSQGALAAELGLSRKALRCREEQAKRRLRAAFRSLG